MTHVPPKDGLPPDIREAIKRAMPQENYVRGVTESGEEYRLVAIPVPGPGDRLASGPVRLGIMAHLGLGDLDD